MLDIVARTVSELLRDEIDDKMLQSCIQFHNGIIVGDNARFLSARVETIVT